jgi:hypothetical protein
MSNYDYASGAEVGLAFGSFFYGTKLIIQYPANEFTWSFYTSPITREGIPKDALGTFLKDSGIHFNSKPFAIAPGSIQGVKGTIQVNNFNGARALDAEVARVQSLYGSSIRGGVATSGDGLRMSNLNDNGRTLDLRFQTRSFLTGATDHFHEVKTGVQDLKGTKPTFAVWPAIWCQLCSDRRVLASP